MRTPHLPPLTTLTSPATIFSHLPTPSPASTRPRLQAYEGLQTAAKLRQEYLFLPAKVKEVYLVHLLGQLEELQCRSAIIFAGTCKVGGGWVGGGLRVRVPRLGGWECASVWGWMDG